MSKPISFSPSYQMRVSQAEGITTLEASKTTPSFVADRFTRDIIYTVVLLVFVMGYLFLDVFFSNPFVFPEGSTTFDVLYFLGLVLILLVLSYFKSEVPSVLPQLWIRLSKEGIIAKDMRGEQKSWGVPTYMRLLVQEAGGQRLCLLWLADSPLTDLRFVIEEDALGLWATWAEAWALQVESRTDLGQVHEVVWSQQPIKAATKTHRIAQDSQVANQTFHFEGEKTQIRSVMYASEENIWVSPIIFWGFWALVGLLFILWSGKEWWMALPLFFVFLFFLEVRYHTVSAWFALRKKPITIDTGIQTIYLQKNKQIAFSEITGFVWQGYMPDFSRDALYNANHSYVYRASLFALYANGSSEKILTIRGEQSPTESGETLALGVQIYHQAEEIGNFLGELTQKEVKWLGFK